MPDPNQDLKVKFLNEKRSELEKNYIIEEGKSLFRRIFTFENNDIKFKNEDPFAEAIKKSLDDPKISLNPFKNTVQDNINKAAALIKQKQQHLDKNQEKTKKLGIYEQLNVDVSKNSVNEADFKSYCEELIKKETEALTRKTDELTNKKNEYLLNKEVKANGKNIKLAQYYFKKSLRYKETSSTLCGVIYLAKENPAISLESFRKLVDKSAPEIVRKRKNDKINILETYRKDFKDIVDKGIMSKESAEKKLKEWNKQIDDDTESWEDYNDFLLVELSFLERQTELNSILKNIENVEPKAKTTFVKQTKDILEQLQSGESASSVDALIENLEKE